jgi:hypothetical protein
MVILVIIKTTKEKQNMSIKVNVELDVDDIVDNINTQEEAFALIKAVDERFEDWGFTEEITRYFISQMKRLYTKHPEEGSLKKLLKSI